MARSAQDASLPELVRLLADDAKELVRAEVGLAREEAIKTARAGLIAVATCSAGAVVAVLSLCTFIAAAVLAAGGSGALALTAAGAFGGLLVAITAFVIARLLARSKSASAQAAPGLDARASTRAEVSEVTRASTSTPQGQVAS